MTAPSPFARLAGMPIFAILLFIGYGAVITSWFEGHVPWWLALFAALAALRTLKAVGEVRRYKTWLANWNAMDAQEQAPPRRKILTLNRVLPVIAGAAFLFLPLLRAPGTSDSALQQGIWVVSGLYLVFALVRFILRRVRKGSTAQPQSESKPVSWLIDRASSAPSREDATENLPDYCAGLLSSSAKQED
jgi:hypothetical protein